MTLQGSVGSDEFPQAVTVRLVAFDADDRTEFGQIRQFFVEDGLDIEEIHAEIGYQVEDEDLLVADLMLGEPGADAEDLFIERMAGHSTGEAPVP